MLHGFGLFGCSAVLLVLCLLLLLHEGKYCCGRVQKKQVNESKLIGGSCDLFEGSWVYDDTYPLYDTFSSCPFVEKEFDCQKNGRPDSQYLKLRWKPNACAVPRYARTYAPIIFILISSSLNNSIKQRESLEKLMS